MAVKIRLKRAGMPKQPTYRIVVCDSRNPRNGATIANLGFYAPYKPNKPLQLDLDIYQEWISKGAKPTDAVRKLVKQFQKRGESIEVKEKAVKPEVDAVEDTSAEEEPTIEPPVESLPVAEETATETTET